MFLRFSYRNHVNYASICMNKKNVLILLKTFLKIILKRGTVRVAPWSFHYDPYLMKTRSRYTWLGFRNPIQKLKRKIARWILKTHAQSPGTGSPVCACEAVDRSIFPVNFARSSVKNSKQKVVVIPYLEFAFSKSFFGL